MTQNRKENRDFLCIGHVHSNSYVNFFFFCKNVIFCVHTVPGDLKMPFNLTGDFL